MKTRTAFILRFLLPPFYAALIFTLVSAFEVHRIADIGAYLGIFTLFAYIFAGLPALLFALLLGRFARRRPACGGRLVRAALLGFISGLLITPMFRFESGILFIPLGTLVGVAVEGSVILLERRGRIPA